MHGETQGRSGSPAPTGGREVVAWLLATGLVVLLAVVARPPEGWAAGWEDVVIESGLGDAVRVDLRWRERGGEVEGPIARTLRPGGEVRFAVRSAQPFCLRIIRAGGRITPVYVAVTESATRVRLRVDPSLIVRPAPEAVRCEAELAAHRVRVAPGRYFDPERPDRLRRERILTRSP